MQEINIYTDGGSRGNPGPAGIGIWIETLDKKYAETIGVATNNDAEYQALIFALKKVKTLLGRKKSKEVKINCFLDSELIVKQLNHQYKIQAENTQRYFLQVWNLTVDFNEYSFTHIRREKNKVADGLVNKALDEVML
jgi:ribonuclease HI